MAGVNAMGELAHELESLIGRIELGLASADEGARAVAQEALDELARMREATASGRPAAGAPALVARIHSVAAGESPAPPAPPAVAPACRPQRLRRSRPSVLRSPPRQCRRNRARVAADGRVAGAARGAAGARGAADARASGDDRASGDVALRRCQSCRRRRYLRFPGSERRAGRYRNSDQSRCVRRSAIAAGRARGACPARGTAGTDDAGGASGTDGICGTDGSAGADHLRAERGRDRAASRAATAGRGADCCVTDRRGTAGATGTAAARTRARGRRSRPRGDGARQRRTARPAAQQRR